MAEFDHGAEAGRDEHAVGHAGQITASGQFFAGVGARRDLVNREIRPRTGKVRDVATSIRYEVGSYSS